ncbi:MAG: SBBP repeat-containing protein [candidate division WOR-3 bacterium]
MLVLNLLVTFASSVGGKFVNTYDPAIVKDWLNSYPYLYKGFTPNKGQLATMDGKIAENVVFYSRNGNMGIFITENGMSYVIYDVEKKEVSKDKDALPHIKEKPENSILHYSRIDYELIGGKIKKENIIYQDELPGYENFYLAHCPDGILFVKSYRKVIIKDIYPGINWIFRYDDNGNFHHEFEVKNPQLISQIKLKVKYADIELVDNGKSIILSTPIGKIKDGNLIGYQGKDIVEVSYKLIDNNLIAFDVKSFDKNKSLLIDPYALVWGTYYGGSSVDVGYSITTDGQGNVFVTGYTYSTNFPTYNPGGGAYYQSSKAGSSDAFIAKFGSSPGDIVETSNKSTFFKVYKNTLIFYVLNKPSYIEITIYNANGSLNRVIKYGYVQIGKYEIGLNSLPKGVYIVNVKIDNNSNWIKFIKN